MNTSEGAFLGRVEWREGSFGGLSLFAWSSDRINPIGHARSLLNVRVLVAGGGVAGVAAAVSASNLGASVTIAEGSGRLALNRCLLPRLLREGPASDDLGYSDPDELSGRYGIDVKIGEQVLAAEVVARSAKTSSGRITFDVLVLATGTQGRLDEIRGASKPGVFVLNSVEDYTSLSEALDNLTSLAVVVLSQPLSSWRRQWQTGAGSLPSLGELSDRSLHRGCWRRYLPRLVPGESGSSTRELTR